MRRGEPRFFFSLLNAVLGLDFFLVWIFFELWSFFFFFRGQSYFFVTFRRRGNVTVRGLMHENKYPR